MGRISSKLADAGGPVQRLFAEAIVWDNHTRPTTHPARAEALAQSAALPGAADRHRATALPSRR